MNTSDGVFIKVIDDTGELLREARTVQNKTVLSAWEQKYANGVLRFSEKEISKMPKEFRKEFKAGKITAHVRKKSNGVFEIRCQIQKEKIAVSSKRLDTAKEKFINELNGVLLRAAAQTVLNGVGSPVAVRVDKRVKLCDYMAMWLDTVKKPAVKGITFKEYQRLFSIHIRPAFEGRELAAVKGFEMQAFLNGFTERGLNRTAVKLHQLLAAMFDYAVMDDLIAKSPMQRIALAKYEEAHGVPLTREEESAFIKEFTAAPTLYAQAFAFLLYTGLRRSELASVSLSDGFVTVTTSKQRKGMKERTRAIPVSPMLVRVLSLIDVERIKRIAPNTLTCKFKPMFPSHHLHDLRHTFITRAQECGISRELVSLWAGHAADSSTTTLVYTHLEQNREHQAAAMLKFDYPLA